MIQNLAYALIQVIHNLGAVVVVGSAVYGLWRRDRMGRPLLLLMAAGWAVQAASGAAFGIASYAFYGRFPDIHGVAVTALFIKAACAVVGFFLAGIACLKWSRMQRHAFSIGLLSSMLALVALSAAAFLRWFS